jgi:DNA-binding transcriptional ArsR family regulator
VSAAVALSSAALDVLSWLRGARPTVEGWIEIDKRPNTNGRTLLALQRAGLVELRRRSPTPGSAWCGARLVRLTAKGRAS